MKRVFLVLFLFILIYPVASGQLWKLRRYEVYGSFGTSQFFGDIGGFSPTENLLGLKDFTINQTRFAIGGGLRYRIYEKFSVKAGISYGFIHASDAKGSNESREYEVSTSLFEPAVTAEYYILKNSAEGSYRFTKGDRVFTSILDKIDFFVFAGVAPIIFSVKPNEKLALATDETGGVAMAFPAGIGLNYLISPNVLLGIDIGVRYTTTDYIDGYTSQYSKSNDVYYFMTFVFTQKLKTSEKGFPSFRK
ncbi:MAG: DUF6089 family protein [Bacteroidales bacterium]|nr:DUF6089 family protein [Bacteroidales bacterium]